VKNSVQLSNGLALKSVKCVKFVAVKSTYWSDHLFNYQLLPNLVNILLFVLFRQRFTMLKISAAR